MHYLEESCAWWNWNNDTQVKMFVFFRRSDVGCCGRAQHDHNTMPGFVEMIKIFRMWTSH
jgi:hypothetical protein